MHNVVLIGAGRIGRIHARNIAMHPRLQLRGVIDANEASARSVAAQWGAEVIDLEAALHDEAVHGIVVASSTDTHLDYSAAAIQAGKKVFCEKPLDQDLQRARRAARQFDGSNLLVAFNRRFDPNFQALKSRLDSGKIGSIESLQITSNDPAPPPASYIAASGGLFKDMAIHDFDMARWLLNEEPSQVYAVGSCLVDPEIGKLGDIDTARTLLTTPTGRLCVISNSRRSGYGYDQRIEAYASAGMVCADNVTETTVEIWRSEGASRDRFQNFFLDRYDDAYRCEMDHFADMLDGAPAAVGYADGVAALALAEAAAQSVKIGSPVTV